jgi:hypothetical protein
MYRAISLALAACLFAGSAGASGMISYSKLSYSYSPRDIAYAGGPGELWTEVAGNPFGATQADFDQAVTQAMYGAHFGPPTKFTTTPGPSARRVFHVRLLFNGTATDDAHICVGPPPAVLAAHGGDIVLYAAFCQDNESLSFLRAAGGGFSGPSDPEFKDFIRQVTTKLFPPQNNELLRNNNDDCRTTGC